jgi:hypothetical protein
MEIAKSAADGRPGPIVSSAFSLEAHPCGVSRIHRRFAKAPSMVPAAETEHDVDRGQLDHAGKIGGDRGQSAAQSGEDKRRHFTGVDPASRILNRGRPAVAPFRLKQAEVDFGIGSRGAVQLEVSPQKRQQPDAEAQASRRDDQVWFARGAQRQTFDFEADHPRSVERQTHLPDADIKVATHDLLDRVFGRPPHPLLAEAAEICKVKADGDQENQSCNGRRGKSQPPYQPAGWRTRRIGA